MLCGVLVLVLRGGIWNNSWNWLSTVTLSGWLSPLPSWKWESTGNWHWVNTLTMNSPPSSGIFPFLLGWILVLFLLLGKLLFLSLICNLLLMNWKFYAVSFPLSGVGFSFHDRSHCCLISNEGEHSNESEAKAEQFIFLNLN